MEIFDVFTLNVPFIEFESNRSVESFKNTTHSSRFERGNENSDTPDVSSKSRIRARCINPTVFSFENSSFHSVVSLVDAWNSWKKKKERSRSISKRSPIKCEINENTFVNRRFTRFSIFLIFPNFFDFRHNEHVKLIKSRYLIYKIELNYISTTITINQVKFVKVELAKKKKNSLKRYLNFLSYTNLDRHHHSSK